jgi:hypothetical protein
VSAITATEEERSGSIGIKVVTRPFHQRASVPEIDAIFREKFLALRRRMKPIPGHELVGCRVVGGPPGTNLVATAAR